MHYGKMSPFLLSFERASSVDQTDREQVAGDRLLGWSIPRDARGIAPERSAVHSVPRPVPDRFDVYRGGNARLHARRPAELLQNANGMFCIHDFHAILSLTQPHRVQIAHVIREIRHFQQIPYRIEHIPRVTAYMLDETLLLDDEELYRRSIEYEPRTSRLSVPNTQAVWFVTTPTTTTTKHSPSVTQSHDNRFYQHLLFMIPYLFYIYRLIRYLKQKHYVVLCTHYVFVYTRIWTTLYIYM